jgi:hypothetical protein
MRVLAQAAPATLTVALVSLAAGAEAYAQAPLPPAVPPTPTGTRSTPPSLWRFSLGADASWYENAQFVGSANSSSTWSSSGRATLGYSRRFRSGSFNLAGFGGTIYYPEIDSFNQATYGGSLGLNIASSPHTQFTLGQSVARSNTRQIEVVPGDVPLPTTGLYSASTSLGLTHQLSRSWQLGLNGVFALRRYDEAALVDGEQAGAGVQLGHRVGRWSTLFLRYEFGNSWYASEQSRAHQVLLGTQRHPARGVAIELAAGAAYLEPSQSFYPAGSARLSAGGRHGAFALQYRRDFGQTFGYGRQTIGDTGGASASWLPARSLGFSAGYTYSYRRDAEDPLYKVRAQTASGGVSWGAFRGLSVAARYIWESNQTEGFARVEGSRVAASISYGVEWR